MDFHAADGSPSQPGDTGPPLNPETLVQLLCGRARQNPDRLAYLYLQDGESDESRITYADLDRRARAIAARLQRNTEIGERALLLFPPGLEYIAAYFGCLYAGVVAVPAYPPRLNRPSPRLQGMVADAQATTALATGQILGKLERRFEHMPELAGLRWTNTDEVSSDLSEQWQPPEVTPETLAFLQYTSGSTSAPKGVMVSHGNLMHNLKMIRHGFQIYQSPIGVFWLPSYHDMGLIGGILEPMYVTGPSILMDPAAFLQKPLRWLQALSKYKGTITGAPNFAYQMCVDKVTLEQCEGLDLSHVRVAFCGAEPIHLQVLERFAEKFAPYGFSRETFYPCYGLAEGTLLVSGADGPASPVTVTVETAALTHDRAVLLDDTRVSDGSAIPGEDAQTLVSCGHALLDQEIVIVDPRTRVACGPREIGEIWVAGGSVAQGYWNRPEATAHTFQGRLAPGGQGPYLRTGDLGFLHEGQLYVTGRLKDLIIIRGRNHYPQDIERTVADSHEAFEVGMGAAFSTAIGGQERLVVTFELQRSHRHADVQEVTGAARRAIAAEHGLQPYAIQLLKPFSIPRTSSGKIKRHACRQGFLDDSLDVIGEWRASPDGDFVEMPGSRSRSDVRAPETAQAAQVRQEIEEWLVHRIASQLQVPTQQIAVDRPFVDFGLDSVQAVRLTGELETWLKRSLSPTLVWDYPTIQELSAHLARSGTSGLPDEQPGPDPVPARRPSPSGSRSPVAVVGLGCRFPGAAGPDEFWQLLHDGVDAIGEVPPQRWDVDAYYGEDDGGAAPGKMNTRWGGFLQDVDLFDPHFFGISPREAQRMDPQQRLLLEVTWEALERAGQAPSRLAGSRTGVFVGISSYDYSRLQLGDPQRIDAYAGTGNAHSIAANRLSYVLDLRGPSVAVDTACSSSLVAVHLALQSLHSGESDLALAGGVNLLLSPELTITFSQARMMAPDGRCKTFDAAADGYVRGEGAGVVVLKRLEDAVRDGDPILAVLYGSAVNQDGRSNGLTAPNGPAQQDVIRRALQDAGVAPADVSYVEAHGTGTSLGDPIEVQSLRAVLEGDGPPPQCFLGSVKTNVGHLEAAAGVAGLFKVVLSLQHEEIPPHLHFNELNPYISLDGSPLTIAAQRQPWPRGQRPRLAGVSSFGFGGTNAHLILGDWTQPGSAVDETDQISAAADQPILNLQSPISNPQSPLLLPLSAKNDAALRQLAGRYAQFLEQAPGASMVDVCYTAALGRDHFQHRAAFAAGNRSELIEKLRRFADTGTQPNPQSPISNPQPPPRLAFLFTGQGAQYSGMARRLYETQPVFRAALARCDEILQSTLDVSLLDVLFCHEAGDEEGVQPPENGDSEPSGAGSLLDQTAYTQPALFAVEYALAQLWRSWGIEPDVVMGHSVGELVAACVAGVFSLEDGLHLVAARGRLMQSLPRDGSMAVIFAGRERVASALAPHEDAVDIAAVNGPENVTISGKTGAVEAVLAALAEGGVESRSLTVSHAFHSPLMAPILDDFEAEASKITYQSPQIPLISNVTGKVFAQDEVPDAAYWRDHVRRPVDFVAGVETLAAGMETLAESGATVLLEAGPQPHLLGMARRILERSADADGSAQHVYLPSLRRKQDDAQTMLQSLGDLYRAGVDVAWEGLYAGDGQPRKIALPTYPFQRERYWLDGDGPTSGVSLPVPETASGDVQRLQTAVPLYQARFDADREAFDAFARRLLQAAADDFWGEAVHEVQSLLAEEPDGDEPLTVQLVLAPQGDDRASAQLFRLDAASEKWHLCGSAQVQRGKAEAPPASQEVGSTAPAVTKRERLLAADDAERVAVAAEYLRAQTAQVLGLAPQRLETHRPLGALGMDSLMAIELRNRLEQQLDVTLPVVNFLQGPSVDDLARQLVARLEESDRAQPAITPAERDPQEPAPLAYGQQAMWFLHQLLPEDVAFNVAGAVRVWGQLDVSALRRALQAIIERHAALRTTFTMRHGQPAQQVQGQIDLPFHDVDARDWTTGRLQAYVEREAHRPFDLDAGPLLRLVLLRRSDEEHVLVLSVNHLVTDFWSMSLLVQELYLLYKAQVSGTEADLPLPDLQYTDYVYWEREMLSGQQGERLRNYWLKQLDGDLPVLDLPTDRPRPPQQTFRGDTAGRRFSPELAYGLRALAREQGATLATTLLAGFQALLHRYTGQEDLLVGSVLSGRERPELASLVGYFINPVALRADFSRNPSFAEFLSQARQTVLDAFEHQDYPLPRLAEHLPLKRDPARPPLFETMFIMQKAQVMEEQGLSAFALGMPGARMELQNLTLESMALGGLPAQFDLTLMMAELEDGLAASLHYNTALFDEETAQRMLAHLEALLQGAVDAPERPLSQLPLLSEAERRQLLVTWNQTDIDTPRACCLHRLIEAQAARTPQQVAVVCESQQLTYGQLDERANRLAHHLQRLGVEPGVLVGVALNRSPQMLVALLGVLKAGGAYVPLDPGFPKPRLKLMLEDARPRVILTEEQLVDHLPPCDAELLCLDEAWPVVAQSPASPPESLTTAEDLAYVIYTSGSTGRPKGVQIPHRALVNFLGSMRREPGLQPGDVMLAVTTLSFDIAVLELYLPLITGARVVIAPSDVAADGLQLRDLLQTSGATVMQATPATWRMLLAVGWEGKDDLKILCGGEALPRDLADALLARGAEVWNMYGPTETTVWSTIHRVAPGECPVPIGQPIANTQLYILAEGSGPDASPDKPQAAQPVPVGVVGELYIGGDGVAHGYLHRPDLTAERFIPVADLPFASDLTASNNGHSPAADSRLYRTGDLARYLPDGKVIFLGRRDHQVKVHGHRIELGDVEAALGRHPALQQAVVVARGEGDGRRLVAYVVPGGEEASPTSGELRQFLQGQLPDYMVPALFVTLDELPLTPNNKVDRSALPAPAQGRPDSGPPFVAPRSPLEQALAQLCADVLSLSEERPVGLHDSFFDLGGNSLLATRLVFEVRERYQVQIPLRRLFAEPTVAGLAQAVQESLDSPQLTVAEGHDWTMTVDELNAEAVLDPQIRAGEGRGDPATEPQHVFLTGATGFLGAFLLNDLLQETEAVVHCLVRAADAGAGLRRLRRNLETYGLWDEDLASRIVAVPGDLGRALLGQDEEAFRRLAQQMDVIFHNGAMVNFVYPYAAHKAANVQGTQEVLRLAAEGSLKPVHFVSTLSVFHTGEHVGDVVYAEDDALDDVGAPFGGYAQSKWVAEKLVMEAGERGIPVAIYRPGLVSGHSRSGAWNTEDMMTTMARISALIGAVPDLDTDEKETQVDVVPVDYVSRAIVHLSQRATFQGQVFHLNNPNPLPYAEFLDWVRSAGLDVQVVPFDRWRQRLTSLALQAGGNGAVAFLPLLEEVSVEQVFMPAFDCHNTLAGLEDADLSCPPVGPDLLQTYLDYFRRQGLIPGKTDRSALSTAARRENGNRLS